MERDHRCILHREEEQEAMVGEEDSHSQTEDTGMQLHQGQHTHHRDSSRETGGLSDAPPIN